MVLATAGVAAAGPSFRPFASTGSGTETSLSLAGCQFTYAGCTVQTNGYATSSYLGYGPYVSTLTVYWVAAYSNGNGGYCAPAAGTGVLTATNGDTLTQSEAGIVCEVGATGPNVAHTFTGIFTNTGGTGPFRRARGGGIITGGDNGLGSSNYLETGTIFF